VLLLWQLIEIGLLPLVRRRPALAIVPGRGSDGLTGLAEIELCKLEQPRLDSPVSALVVDMHQPLSPEWGRFVAECAASGLPIYHVAAVYEAATNRVPLAYLSDTLM